MISIVSRSKSTSLSSAASEDQPYSSTRTLNETRLYYKRSHYGDAAIKHGSKPLLHQPR